MTQLLSHPDYSSSSSAFVPVSFGPSQYGIYHLLYLPPYLVRIMKFFPYQELSFDIKPCPFLDTSILLRALFSLILLLNGEGFFVWPLCFGQVCHSILGFSLLRHIRGHLVQLLHFRENWNSRSDLPNIPSPIITWRSSIHHFNSLYSLTRILCNNECKMINMIS